MSIVRFFTRISLAQHLKKLNYIHSDFRKFSTEDPPQQDTSTKENEENGNANVEGGEDPGPPDPYNYSTEDYPISYFEAWERKGRRYPKAEIGNFSHPGTLDAEFVKDSVRLDKKKAEIDPLYNLSDAVQDYIPGIKDGDGYKGGLESEPLSEQQRVEIEEYEEMLKQLQKNTMETRLFEWVIYYVCCPGNYDHPKNRKVKMCVKMNKLQEYYNLSDEAVRHIIEIVQKRYDPKKGVLTLISDKFQNREDNRREIMRIVNELIKEGKSRYPSTFKRRMYTKSYVHRRYGVRLIDPKEIEQIEQRFKEDFNSIDYDKDGKLSVKEWKRFFHENGTKMPKKAIKDMMLIADKDKDGHLNYEEFKNGILKAVTPKFKEEMPYYPEYDLVEKYFDNRNFKSKK